MLEKYKCDICGKQFDTERVRNISVPTKIFGDRLFKHKKEYNEDGESYFKSVTDVRMCDRCFEYYWKLNQKGFAEIKIYEDERMPYGAQLDVSKNF